MTAISDVRYVIKVALSLKYPLTWQQGNGSNNCYISFQVFKTKRLSLCIDSMQIVKGFIIETSRRGSRFGRRFKGFGTCNGTFKECIGGSSTGLLHKQLFVTARPEAELTKWKMMIDPTRLCIYIIYKLSYRRFLSFPLAAGFSSEWRAGRMTR